MNIALIAHDAKKKLMQNFCIAYRGILTKNVLFATGTTGTVSYTHLNHPSGDASPSRQDIEITKHLAELCGMMQLPLIDHIIVGDNCYVSFRESGLLK